MSEPTVIAVDPPPPTGDFDSGLPIPPLDPAFFSQQLIGNDGALGANPEDMDLDFYLDLSFDDDFCLMDDLLNPTQLQQFDTPTGADSNFAQFASDLSEFDHYAVLNSTTPEINHLRGDGNVSGNHSSNGSGVFSSVSPGIESRQISGCLNISSPELNRGSTEKWVGESKELNYHSPESQGSGNCESKISDDSHNGAAKSVSTLPNSHNNLIIGGVVDQKIELDSKNNNVKSSLLKRKNEAEDMMMNNIGGSRISKYRKSDCNSENYDDTHENDGLGGDDDDKRKARLIRNRGSAQLSRQRKKQYVEELEEKVKAMNSTIQNLNTKISYFMAENVALRQQVGGAGIPPPPMAPPPPGMYPYPAMMYPWMPYASPYMVKPQGSQVPLIPIPRLKTKQPAQAPKVNKKVDSKKNEGTKTKKVAGVSFLGLLFFIMLFGGMVPMVNVKYGGVREAFTGGSCVGGGISEKHHGRVLMLNGTEYSGSRRECRGNSNVNCGREPNTNEFVNGSDPLVASLYIPRNDKLVKIDGNLIIHSILASDKSLASHGKESGETSLAVPGDLAPALPVAGVVMNGAKHSPLAATDGKLQQWFREGLSGPMLTSGMCTEVFQFDVSQTIVPATTTRNIFEEQNRNSTHLTKQKNRRILYDLPIPLPESSHNFSWERNNQKEKLNGNNNVSSMVVSVLVDPREAGDADVDGVMGPKSLSRIFVVVLIDSVKYVTYSCMLPFKTSGAPHLVTT